MTWATNPLFRQKQVVTEDAAASPRQVILHGIKQGFLEPTKKLTLSQTFYLLFPHGLIAAVISGGINLAIAVAMYSWSSQPATLFRFPNTVSGDAAVTIIIQCITTWLIELLLVNTDLRSGKVQPIGFIPEPKMPVLRWFLFLSRATPETREAGSLAHWAQFLFSQVLRALLVSVAMFVLLWGPCVGILTVVGTRTEEDGGMDWVFVADLRVWTVPVFKGVLGGVLGLLTTPAFAGFWMVRCGWALIRNEEYYGEH